MYIVTGCLGILWLVGYVYSDQLITYILNFQAISPSSS